MGMTITAKQTRARNGFTYELAGADSPELEAKRLEVEALAKRAFGPECTVCLWFSAEAPAHQSHLATVTRGDGKEYPLC
jgi:hypothetical protein